MRIKEEARYMYIRTAAMLFFYILKKVTFPKKSRFVNILYQEKFQYLSLLMASVFSSSQK
jgi:hypothetical protein